MCARAVAADFFFLSRIKTPNQDYLAEGKIKSQREKLCTVVVISKVT